MKSIPAGFALTQTFKASQTALSHERLLNEHKTCSDRWRSPDVHEKGNTSHPRGRNRRARFHSMVARHQRCAIHRIRLQVQNMHQTTPAAWRLRVYWLK